MSEPLPPVAPPDLAAAERMWAEYASAHPEALVAGDEHVVEGFGDSAPLADALLALVLHGPKRATAALSIEYAEEGQQLPRIGGHWIACDGSGAPRAILRTTELRLGGFDSVDEAFAWDEGEDDRSLESWRREHRRYWERTRAAAGSAFDPADEIVFERFSVVWPPQHADVAPGQGA